MKITTVQRFPFSAFVGCGVAQRAMLCALVDRTLSGVILAGAAGTGKSALIRSFAQFVQSQVDPESPVVYVPLNVGDDRLIGGVDIAHALDTGQRRLQPGLLQQADNGLLCVDDLPLLDRQSAFTIVSAMESGRLLVEREGLSQEASARFILLATAFGQEINRDIADRVAFLIAPERRLGTDSVSLLLRRMESFGRDPHTFAAEYSAGERRYAEQVISARMISTLTPIPIQAVEYLDAIAVKYGVEGNRAVVFAAKAARAHAALRGSRMIELEDLSFAVATVLVPRALQIPAPTDEQKPPEAEQQHQTQGQAGQDEDQEGQAQGTGISQEVQEEEQDAGQNKTEGAREEDGQTQERSGGSQVFDPLDFNAPIPELEAFFPARPQQTKHSGGGKPTEQWRRGRHTRSVQAHLSGKRIALGATMRAAAVRQRERRGEGEQRVIVRKEDIRVKKFSQRVGTLFIFCVDASGSMASNRIREAKGALTRLLQEAYVNRDSVALIICRGAEADVLLPPTGSVERAKRSIDVTPTGGGTPLASTLLKAYHMADRARRTGAHRALVVLLTDGRANVPMTGNPADMIATVRRRHVRQELEHLAGMYRREKLDSVVIDTRHAYDRESEAAQLAALLGGAYYYLPLMNAGGIVSAIRSMRE